MIRSALLVLIAALVSLCCTAKKEPSAAGIGRRIIPIETTAFTGTHGALVVTGYGELMRTDDGGATWERVPREDALPFESVCFTDSLNGWAVDEPGHVLRTTDSGRTWVRLSKLDLGDYTIPVHVTFVDGLHGWVVDPFSIWVSEDGGITWERHYPDLRIPDVLFASCFLSPKVGWLRGSGEALFRTDDGGRTWAARAIPVKAELRDILFISESIGWIGAGEWDIVRDLPVGGLYRTEDGGDTWEQMTLPGPDTIIMSVNFVSEDEGWAVGSVEETADKSLRMSQEVALHTTDGGRTWDAVWVVNQDQASPYRRVFFADAQHGWIVGEAILYRTDDGGTTWREVLRLRSTDEEQDVGQLRRVDRRPALARHRRGSV